MESFQLCMVLFAFGTFLLTLLKFIFDHVGKRK